MDSFFRPPPACDEAVGAAAVGAAAGAPPWTGRPQGPPSGAVVDELLLAESARGEVYVLYLDAYPEGFELKISASARISFQDLRREGDPSGPDVFGRHWPMVDEPRDVIPPEVLRVGVQFADGRGATNISGRDRPADGPAMWALGGGGRGHGGESEFHQGYWVSPLPPPGTVTIVCEWPAGEIPLSFHEIDAQAIVDAAARSEAMFPASGEVVRDGRSWRLGRDADAEWITAGTSASLAITAAIPEVFEAYATLVPPGHHEPEALAQHERAVIDLVTEQTGEQPWWLGYLDTGASNVVFPYAPRVELYDGYSYVLVEAGPAQAIAWRDAGFNGALPDLIFPADRSWLLSTMWDDAWTSIGGPESGFLTDSVLGPKARRVAVGEDATPPGHESR